MKQLRFILIAVVLLLLSNYGLSQERLPLMADSLATGNSKDVFKSFFQLALNRFIGNSKEIQFTSNPFAVMAKMDTTLLIDTNYYKLRRWRNLNFSFSGKLDTAYRFNGFSSSIKYAIINGRDETVSRDFLVSAYNANHEFNQLNDRMNAFLSTLPMDDERSKYRSELDGLFNTGTLTFDKIDATLQKKLRDEAKQINAARFLKLIETNPKLDFHQASQLTYDSLKKHLQNKLLWTAELSDTTYNNQFLFSNIVFTTQVLKGVLNPERSVNMELDIKAGVQWLDNTLLQGRDLKRGILTFEPGVNLVFKSKYTQRSWGEFKVSGGFTHSFSHLYANEKRDNLNLNGALRIRIIDDVWVPLEFSYDPRSGNVLGVLNVRANFTGMSRLLKGL